MAWNFYCEDEDITLSANTKERKLQIRGKSRGNVGISVELIVTTQ